ncbi:hypothetical protein DXG01_003047 [Tephrocybe rancida]|nr:hypothetical protein DXG01_003047 [Tephrocybe rancida]
MEVLPPFATPSEAWESCQMAIAGVAIPGKAKWQHFAINSIRVPRPLKKVIVSKFHPPHKKSLCTIHGPTTSLPHLRLTEGHVLQNYRNEATEAEDMGQHAMRKRALKSGRKKKEPGSKANPALYHGARGRYHYFECLQLLLRKQIATLVKLWTLPQEFEVVCRDIWALHIEQLPEPPSAEPYHYAQEQRDDEEGEDYNAAKEAKAIEDSDEEEDKQSDEDEEDAEDKKGRDEDPELATLLRVNSDLEESSESGDDDGPVKHRGKIKGQKRGHKIYESPASTIAVIVVGCWTLRIPVLCCDFTRQVGRPLIYNTTDVYGRLIESYQLPYLDPIQRHLLPKSMIAHLTKHSVQALSPYGSELTYIQHAPSTQTLHELASRLSKMMHTAYGIFTPEANAAPILWRVVSQGLGGTPMLYRLTKRLGQILSLPLTLHHTLAPGLEKRRTYDPERHVYDNIAPEVSLMAIGIIVLKLVYGLDGRTRTPVDGTDVACGLAQADEYLAGLRGLEAKDEATKEMDSWTDVSMGDASSEMMDAYLDFSERVLIGDGDGGRAEAEAEGLYGRAVLERFFAVSRVGDREGRRASGVASQRLEAIVAQEEDGMRPGEGYHGESDRTTEELAVHNDDQTPFLVVMRRLVAAFKRDKQPPPPLVTDQAHSSASSSSGSASLYLQTPEDDQHIPVTVDRQASKKSWHSWLKRSNKKPLPDWAPSHDIEDSPYESSIVDEPPGDSVEPFTVLVKNSLQPLQPPSAPFSYRSDVAYIFPKSVNLASSLPRVQSLEIDVLKRRLHYRLQVDNRPFTKSELRSIASLASRRITPVVPVKQPPHPFNEPAPSKTTIITPSSPGLGNWVSRPCFEDRYDLFIPEQDGIISRRPIVGSNLAVAALEFSETIESMVDFDLIQPTAQLAIEIPTETVPSPPSSSGQSRNSPYIAVPSPLRNEHNLPPLSISNTQSAPPAVPASMDPLVKRGVRFAEDGKDDVIPLGYVLRMKKKREEKAKFLKSEQERRLLEDERMRIEEERRKRDAERAEWANERKAWEKEKRAMDEERRQRKYAEEVVAARLRRETQRAGGVPALKSSESNGFLAPNGGGAGYFSASASSSASERNKPPTASRHSRPVYDDGGAPVYLPRREASEPNLPARTTTSPSSFPITSSPRGSLNSHSPGSSRPPSVIKDTPPSAESTHSPSVYSSQEAPSSSEDVKAAVAAAAKRTKRNSFATSMSASHNNSSTSLSGDRATSYPVWTGSNHSLNSMIPPVPMMPMQMQMMPMPPFVMMDMPLLPPTPPFMMQQYPRQNGSPGSSGSNGTGGSLKGRLGGSPNSSRERLGSPNSSRERVNVIGGTGRIGSGERSESRGPSSRSSSFPRPEAPRHTPSSPALGFQSQAAAQPSPEPIHPVVASREHARFAPTVLQSSTAPTTAGVTRFTPPANPHALAACDDATSRICTTFAPAQPLDGAADSERKPAKRQLEWWWEWVTREWESDPTTAPVVLRCTVRRSEAVEHADGATETSKEANDDFMTPLTYPRTFLLRLFIYGFSLLFSIPPSNIFMDFINNKYPTHKLYQLSTSVPQNLHTPLSSTRIPLPLRSFARTLPGKTRVQSAFP